MTNISLDLVCNILSFLHIREILLFKNRELLKNILEIRNIFIPFNITNSIFYSFHDRCYKCLDKLYPHHFINLCSSCNITLDSEQHCQKICGNCMGDVYIPYKQNLKIINCGFCNKSSIFIKTDCYH